VQDIIRDWLGGLSWKSSTRVAVDVDPYSFL
jgi:primosomal protein N' (replication factor Y)